ncbi:protein SMALL AUXIN UP-REGULATED RNA 54-like [Humulus lupulus]|uniref:protein SMALL AUXIN UP-REGULATED RNA 54-like n=1 Tax=Humulus lupulus TaxID=3486 RepID=UPI002B40F7E3|nr:protein SMALL AUXIN UP-REGULATED RNA 54-like [Humulus lupulus]
MCTRKYYGEEGTKGLLMLRLFVGSLQRRLSLLAAATERDESDLDEELEVATTVPEDVKEGHFAVLAVNGAEKKRFVIKLDYLTIPEFQRLLEQAEEEYGFEQSGTLAVPCRPEDLQKILRRHTRDKSSFCKEDYAF